VSWFKYGYGIAVMERKMNLTQSLVNTNNNM